MGRGGGAQRPVWGGSELKKTGARSARARMRSQNPLVFTYLAYDGNPVEILADTNTVYTSVYHFVGYSPMCLEPPRGVWVT
jgi:hypothetical protein